MSIIGAGSLLQQIWRCIIPRGLLLTSISPPLIFTPQVNKSWYSLQQKPISSDYDLLILAKLKKCLNIFLWLEERKSFGFFFISSFFRLSKKGKLIFTRNISFLVRLRIWVLVWNLKAQSHWWGGGVVGRWAIFALKALCNTLILERSKRSLWTHHGCACSFLLFSDFA